VLEDMKTMGAPPEAIEQKRAEFDAEQEAVVVRLPADCRLAVRAFLAVATQWNKLVAGDRLIATGLDYAGVRVALRSLRIPLSPALFDDLQAMEDEALLAMAERR
jgi:hypothetical protein